MCARLRLEHASDEAGEDWAVERLGAEALSFRIEQQAHWQQAESVLDGRQVRVDPDGLELEEVDNGLRVYRMHEVPGMMDGRRALLSQRLVKRLVDGVWESDLVVESYRYADDTLHV
jgi:hypothetical protein